jgi:hypothetical protein
MDSHGIGFLRDITPDSINNSVIKITQKPRLIYNPSFQIQADINNSDGLKPEKVFMSYLYSDPYVWQAL